MTEVTDPSEQNGRYFPIVLWLLGFLIFIVFTLDFGRLLVTLTALRTGAREAVRYGIQPGANVEGTPYFQDCDGIRSEAMRSALVGRFKENEIEIALIHLKDSSDPFMDAACPEVQVADGDRLAVRIQKRFRPLPGLNFASFMVNASREADLPNTAVEAGKAQTATPAPQLSPSPVGLPLPAGSPGAPDATLPTQAFPPSPEGQSTPQPPANPSPGGQPGPQGNPTGPAAAGPSPSQATPTSVLQPAVPARPTPTDD